MITIGNPSFHDIYALETSCDLVARLLQVKMENCFDAGYLNKECMITFRDWKKFEAKSIGLVKLCEFDPDNFKVATFLHMTTEENVTVIEVECEEGCYFELRMTDPFIETEILPP